MAKETGLGTTRGGGLDDAVRADALRVLMILDEFLRVRPDIPMSHARSLLLVALDEGKTVKWYARKAGVAQSVMTRQLFDIGEFTRDKTPGLGLVERRANPQDLREHQLYLTHKGRALVERAARVIRTGSGR
jgi:DNA-binding MarR family transcriptional regulator